MQNKIAQLFEAAMHAEGFTSFDIISISHDVSTILNVDTGTPTYNVICMPQLDTYDLLVGTVLAQRSTLRGKNSSRSLPPKVEFEHEGVKYVFWVNSVEGAFLAAAKFVPFITMALDSTVYVHPQAEKFCTRLLELSVSDKSSYLSNCLSTLGAIMNKNTINAIDVLVVAYMAVVVHGHEHFKGVLKAQDFEVELQKLREKEDSVSFIALAVEHARAGRSIINKPVLEEGDEGVLRMEFARAVGDLVTDYTSKAQDIAAATDTARIESACFAAEQEAVVMAQDLNKALARARLAYEGS